MKIGKNNLITAILAVSLAPSLSAASQGADLDLSFTADIPGIGNTLIDSKIAAASGDSGAMRDIAMQPFDGSIARNADSTPVVLDTLREETRKEISRNAAPAAVEEAGKDIPSTAKAVKSGISSKVPALSKASGEDGGNIANTYIEKGLKAIAIAGTAALLVGGAVAGAVLLGGPGIAIGLVVGGVILGVLATKALKAFVDSF